jgi:hypothetical protein
MYHIFFRDTAAIGSFCMIFGRISTGSHLNSTVVYSFFLSSTRRAVRFCRDQNLSEIASWLKIFSGISHGCSSVVRNRTLTHLVSLGFRVRHIQSYGAFRGWIL